MPYLDIDLKYYDLGMENRDAVSGHLRQMGLRFTSLRFPDERSSHNRFCQRYQAVLCRSQMRYHHPRRGSSRGVQAQGDVEESQRNGEYIIPENPSSVMILIS